MLAPWPIGDKRTCRSDLCNNAYQGVLTTSDLSAVTTGEEIQNELQPQEPKPADRAVVPDPNATLPDVTVLLEAGADLNAREENGWTPLHLAAGSSETPGIIAALLEAGADLNARDRFGQPPLHTAARSSKIPGIVTALLEAGADLNVRDQSDKTPGDMIPEDSPLRGSDVYWRLNDARFQ